MCYKVVTSTSHPEIFSSCCPYNSVSYRINYWTKPFIKNSKLFVFKRLKDTVLFLKNNNFYDRKVFICGVQNLTECTTICSNPYKDQSFWNGFYDFTAKPEQGTYLADSVKLLKEISLGEFL